MKADEKILMSTFLLVPGAGGDAWYWSRVVGQLTRRGHEAIAAAEGHDDVVLVAQSMGPPGSSACWRAISGGSFSPT